MAFLARAAFLAVLIGGTGAADPGPVFGILGVPAAVSCDSVFAARSPAPPLPASSQHGSCFANVYATWLEQGGARTVGIPFDASEELLDTLLDSVNGVLFTGGGLSLLPNTTYYKTARAIFERVQRKNEAGVHLPLHGTCMGFQLLSILAADDEGVLSHHAFDSESLSLPLQLTHTAFQSGLFGDAPPDIMRILTRENVTANLHHDGVDPSLFQVRSETGRPHVAATQSPPLRSLPTADEPQAGLLLQPALHQRGPPRAALREHDRGLEVPHHSDTVAPGAATVRVERRPRLEPLAGRDSGDAGRGSDG